MESIQPTRSGPTEDKSARLSGAQAAYALTRSVTPYDHESPSRKQLQLMKVYSSEKKLRHPNKNKKIKTPIKMSLQGKKIRHSKMCTPKKDQKNLSSSSVSTNHTAPPKEQRLFKP